MLPGRRFAWALLALVLGALLLGALGSAAGLGYRDDAAAPLRGAAPGPVVVVGVPGLAWTDINPEDTPTLDAWRQEGSTGVLVVRGAHPLTCAADGWLTLGAGQRAAADLPGGGAGTCGPQVLALDPGPAADGAADPARIPDWETWLERTAARPLDARLGTLAATLGTQAPGCVSAYGPLAAVGAADPDGVVQHPGPALPDWDGELSDCAVHLVDGATGLADPGTIADEGVDPATLDAELARVSSAWPEDTVVIVAGLADAGSTPALRAVLITGHEGPGGMLGSTSTRQWGMVTTPDLTATVLTLAGAPGGVPDTVAGQPVSVLERGAPERRARDLGVAAAASMVQQLAGPVLGSLVVVVLGALLLAARRSRTAGAVVATAAAAVPAATFLAGLVPWWRPESWATAGVLLGAVILAWSALIAAVAWAGPWRRSIIGPPAVVCAVTVITVSLDVMWGGRLGLIGLLGVQPVVAGRFYGMGNVGLGIVAAAVLLLAAFLAAALGRGRAAVAVVGTLGVAVAVVDGWPSWGADFGGVPAVLVATGVLALAAGGIRLTPLRFLLIGAGAAVASAVLMLLDWLRPAAQRTHLGAFAQDVVDGTAWTVVLRKLDNSLGILVHYPVSWVAVLLLGTVVWGLARPASPPGRLLAPLWQVPMLYAGSIALVVCWVVGWALNDSGIAIVGIGLGIAVGTLLAVRLRLSEPTPAKG